MVASLILQSGVETPENKKLAQDLVQVLDRSGLIVDLIIEKFSPEWMTANENEWEIEASQWTLEISVRGMDTLFISLSVGDRNLAVFVLKKRRRDVILMITQLRMQNCVVMWEIV